MRYLKAPRLRGGLKDHRMVRNDALKVQLSSAKLRKDTGDGLHELRRARCDLDSLQGTLTWY